MKSIILWIISLVVLLSSFFSFGFDSFDDLFETTDVSQESTVVEFLPPGFDLVKILDESETLGEFCEYSMYYSVQGSMRVTYEQQGKEDTIYSLGLAARTLINELVENNADKKAEKRKSKTGEALQFDSTFNGKIDIVHTCMCSDGYLYVTCDGVTRGFNLGIDAYNEFMREFKNSTCIWTPDHPVTMG